MKKGFSISFTLFNLILLVISFISYYVALNDVLFWISIVLLILQIIITFFCLWLWRLFSRIRLFKNSLPPDLNGKYIGEINFNFNGKPETKKVELEIIQSLYEISVVVTTDLIKSETVTGNLINNNGSFHLMYSYKTYSKSVNDEKVNPESYGTADLLVCGDSLEGKYWTSNKTIGKILVKRIKQTS